MQLYHNQHLNGHAGLILNPCELDLRLFFNQVGQCLLHERDEQMRRAP